MDNYTIYFAPDCHECDEVQQYIIDNSIEINTFILAKEKWVEKGVFVFPSLLKGDEIIAYGSDIIHFLR